MKWMVMDNDYWFEKIEFIWMDESCLDFGLIVCMRRITNKSFVLRDHALVIRKTTNLS